MRLRTIIGALSFGALVVAPQIAQASSHREAPFVTKNPKVDGTDFYAFQSYDGSTGMVTFIANYQPLEDPNGAPNYFSMDDEALYEIMIDNNGDGVEDFTFQFQFQTVLGGTGNAGFSLPIGPSGATKTVAVPFYNVGLIPGTGTALNSTALNVIETYNVNLVTGPRRTGTVAAIANPNGGGNTFNKPADNVGAKSFGAAGSIGCAQGGTGCANPSATSGYEAYANNFIYKKVSIPGCTKSDNATNPVQIFVGQRAEAFAVNLGPIFDLVDAPAGVVTNGLVKAGGYGAVPDPIVNKNVTTIAIQIPADCIQQSAAQTVVGAWTSASVRQARVINPAATYTKPSVEGGAWTQVSRLGNPLVNEVVIGIPDKDNWNSSYPTGDVAAFGNYVEYPTLPAIIDVVYGTDFQPTTFPRTDLVEAFLTGAAGVNAFPAANNPVPAEMIHLNTAFGATPTPLASQSRLGAAACFVHGTLTPANAGCDPYGFPNGRRLIDDTVDIALDVVEGYLLASAPAYPTGTGTQVYFTDGVDQSDNSAGGVASKFLTTFPYLGTPTQGANGNGT